MIGKIRDKKGNIYNSYILAIKYNGWSSKAIVFDEERKLIKCIEYWVPRRNIFVCDSRKDGWITKGKWQRYRWLIEDKNAMSKLVGGLLRKKHSINVQKIANAKGLAIENELPIWNRINNETDSEALLEISFGFHDGTIDSIKENNNELEVAFTCWKRQDRFKMH